MLLMKGEVNNLKTERKAALKADILRAGVYVKLNRICKDLGLSQSNLNHFLKQDAWDAMSEYNLERILDHIQKVV